METLSILQVINLKGGTIDELCNYAKEKGLIIPPDPNYLLSFVELIIIDPLLAYKIRYDNNIPIEKEGVVEEQNVEVLTNESSPKDEQEVAQQTNSDGIVPQDNEENNIQKTPKRVIGIVKFFDSFKGWGFVISNNKGISGKQEYEGKLISLHITSSEWEGQEAPKDREWIEFTPRKTARGWSAINAKRIEYNRDTLLLAMKYRGKYAKIYGSDNKGDHFDENILCKIINSIIVAKRTGIRYYGLPAYDTTKFTEIIDVFCEYIAEMPIERRELTVSQFLEDTSLRSILLKLFTESEYSPEDKKRHDAHLFFYQLLLESVFDSGGLKELSILPNTFDYTLYSDKLATILVKEALSNTSTLVEKWLGEHDVCKNLKLDPFDTNTIPLRLILIKVSGDRSWIEGLRADWSEISEFIKTNNVYAYSFCKYYFLDKNEDFINSHSIVGLFDDETIIHWCDDLMREEVVPLDFLRYLMEQNVEGHLELWSKYVQKGYDVSSSYVALCKGLNNEMRENASVVRSFLNICNENGITLLDIVGNADNLNDEFYLELFVSTGNREYLNRMKDFES